MLIASRPEPSRARRRALLVAASCAGWLVLALFFASEGVLADRYRGRDTDAVATLVYSLQFYGVWAAVTPIVFAIAARYPWHRQSPARYVARHAAVAVATSLVQAAAFALLFWPRYAGPDGTPWTLLQDMVVSHLHSNLVIYALLVAGVEGVDALRRLRAREVQAARLEGELARASLAALRLQLQPHFLFNTLNGISALVADEPEKAERMIARLATLLRRSLDGDGADAVPLARELDTLEAYLAIERERFGARLGVAIDVAPDCLDAAVPGMILQPIVENAIRHGIARRAGPGAITIAARRIDRTLRLEVADEGADDTGARETGAGEAGRGIGLDNTRARLARLHGDAASLVLAPRDGGGTRVTVTLPLHRAGTTP